MQLSALPCSSVKPGAMSWGAVAVEDDGEIINARVYTISLPLVVAMR